MKALRCLKLTQDCVHFTNPFINPFVLFRLPSLVKTTPRYLNFSTCYSVFPLTCSAHWLNSEEAQYLDRFSSYFYSYLVARSWKPIKCMLEILFKGCKQHQIVHKKRTIDPVASNSGTTADSAMTV